jgi:hypothetical protein
MGNAMMPLQSLPNLRPLAESIGARSVLILTPGPQPAIAAAGLSKAGAESLLDWLERHGCGPGEVALDEAGFTVKFQLTDRVAHCLALEPDKLPQPGSGPARRPAAPLTAPP